MILSKILDSIMDLQGDFEFLEFNVGKRKNDYSSTKIQLNGKSKEHLDQLIVEVLRLGATLPETPEVEYEKAPSDMILPDDFYCTTHHPTWVYHDGEWVGVEDLMMDKQIVIDPEENRVDCKPISTVKKDDLIVVGEKGIRIKHPERPRGGVGVFEFMNSDVSPEKPITTLIREIARNLRENTQNGSKVVVVAGPAIIHTGAAPYLARLIELGYVDSLLSGNALAVHDIEYALYGTSLGVDLDQARIVNPRNHIAAINQVMKAGSIKELVKSGKLCKGIFYQLIKQEIPYVLAGSIRDDGPIPEVIKCIDEAQKLYREQVQDAEYVIMLASTLHSIAVGNMLTSQAKIICVDINPAVVTKLSDRGTSQAVGLVTDVGTFLPLLANELDEEVTSIP
ncbi:MAG: ornithine cyclodeaminase, nickel-pincer nucleotide-dependent [Promethearchaeota archaeon]|jgi:lysine-ketoglutarate reductase/saccharopine dehydrogenase-like protein (TIGR00300 family)